MKSLEFLEQLESKFGKGLYRRINYHYQNTKKGVLKKVPIDDFNNWDKDKITSNRGYWKQDKINSYSFYIKYVDNLVCVDFDSKDINDDNLYNKLNNNNCWKTETKKGFHFYIFIDNIAEYTNELKVGKYNDIDLINVKRNTWELPDREIYGEEKHFLWEELKPYFNEDKMNFVSPAVSPVNSDEEQEIDTNEDLDPDFVFEPINSANNYEYDKQELLDIVLQITSKYEYDDWIKIGLALYNITDGNEDGLFIWDKWSQKDTTNYCKEYIITKWNNYMCNPDLDKLIGIGSLKRWAEQDNPSNPYKKIYYEFSNIKYDKKTDECLSIEGKPNIRGIVDKLNKNLIFVKETGEFIITDSKANGEQTWYLKNSAKVKEHYKKYTFKCFYQKKMINPFEVWLSNIERREVRSIGFNPSLNYDTNDIFNLWRGFNIDKEKSEEFNVNDAKPILDHIKNIWCNNNEDTYNYVLDWMSHVLQKPHKKIGVVLCLKSKQGAGKGIILEKLAEIIGDNHYIQNSNANFLFGDFNGMLEAKVLIDLDECFWGGDKKLESIVKNKITEKKQPINKKNKELYIIDDYANYIITTNNDWFAGLTEEDRRHYCIQLNNTLSGRMTDEKFKILKPVIDAPAGAFAKFLFNRDIKQFNPRVYKKSKLAQDQVERNWNSVKIWFHDSLKEGGFSLPNDKFVAWNNILQDEYGNNIGAITIKNKKTNKFETAYFKDWLYNCYNKQHTGGHKFHNDAFYKELKLNCLNNLFKEIRPNIKKFNGRSRFIILPDLEECRKNWNLMQDYDYDWNTHEIDYEIDPCLIDND